jgi:DNA primase
MFKCFSSGMAGDIFTFVMETERLNFQEAAESLAQRFGVPLEYEKGALPREERSLRQMLFDIHDLATAYFQEYFKSSGSEPEQVREYWTGERGFDLDLAESFQIGLAPVDGSELRRRLTDRKFTLEALAKCGLFYQRGNGDRPEAYHARFRNRLMIPIRDHQGRVVAFTARQLAITPPDDPTREAKYINSPETPVFNKGHLLFGLDRARLEAGETNPFLLVEGQLDVIRCHEQGIKTAVAPQGTAITESQLALMKRYAPTVECLLDADSAGQKAALRLLPMAVKTGLEARFLTLPKGEDPDTYLRRGGRDALESLRRESASPCNSPYGIFYPTPQA